MAVKKTAEPPVTNHQTETVTVSNGGNQTREGGPDVIVGDGSGSAPPALAPDLGGQPANIAAATEFDPSGAPVQIVPDVDPSHPAVDDNPRRGTSVDQNRIDFNDPTLPGRVAVEQSLKKQASE